MEFERIAAEGSAFRAERLGRRQVNGFHRTARDDENDTRLFDTLQEYVLDHYPNPHRVGCLDPDLLRRFVETPEQLDLGDPMYLHMFKCAECTRELRELRRSREARILGGAECSYALPSSGMKATSPWRERIALAASITRSIVLRFAEKLKHVFRRGTGIR